MLQYLAAMERKKKEDMNKPIRMVYNIPGSKPIVYMAVMLGPERSGKTTFSTMAQKYFRKHYPHFYMGVLHYDLLSTTRAIYQLKNYAIDSLKENHRRYDPRYRKVIVVDSEKLQDVNKRHELFLFCKNFEITYLQIYMEFDAQEILARCAQVGIELNPETLQNPEYYNFSFLCSYQDNPWQYNCITIFRSFVTDGSTQIVRLYNYLLNCVMLPQEDPSAKSVSKVPVESSNTHQLQMQAGISYKDKVLLGKGRAREEKKTRPKPGR